ncbi:MAG: hypothetical protein ACRCX2_26660 [Paraclostridium sp.]
MSKPANLLKQLATINLKDADPKHKGFLLFAERSSKDVVDNINNQTLLLIHICALYDIMFNTCTRFTDEINTIMTDVKKYLEEFLNKNIYNLPEEKELRHLFFNALLFRARTIQEERLTESARHVNEYMNERKPNYHKTDKYDMEAVSELSEVFTILKDIDSIKTFDFTLVIPHLGTSRVYSDQSLSGQALRLIYTIAHKLGRFDKDYDTIVKENQGRK